MIIAITTFFQSQTNYGQLLQAYALQQTLMQMGHYPYIIRYGFHEQLQSLLCFDFPKVDMAKLQKNLHLSAEGGDQNCRRFDDFRRHHLNLSVNAYNELEELQICPPIADCYITGSDQVWAQLLCHENNRIFFLDFGSKNINRVAYAPSFSMDAYPEELNDILNENLRRFNAVSVREKTGVKICEKLGVNAEWVLDPTMLLEGAYYRQLAKESTTQLPNNYMLVYHVNVERKDLPCWQAIKQYNQLQGITAVAVFANGEGRNDMEFLDEAEYMYPTIQDWLRLIDGSRYVLTTSFHGMIFSILLHKPFLVSLRPDGMFAGNNRVMSILTALGLQQRVVTTDTDIAQLMSDNIDWAEIDHRVELLRNHSLAYLRKSLHVELRKDTVEELYDRQIRYASYMNNKIATLIEIKRNKGEQTSQLKDNIRYLEGKYKKHMRVIRWLGFISVWLLAVNIVLLFIFVF